MFRTPQDVIIAALDFPSTQEALRYVEAVCGHIKLFKIGLQLDRAMKAELEVFDENEAIENLKRQRLLSQKIAGNVFSDLKFLDIEKTMRRASQNTVLWWPKMFTIHAIAGYASMKRVVESTKKQIHNTLSADTRNVNIRRDHPLILAVTLLTSFDDSISYQIFHTPLHIKFKEMVRDAVESGCDGIVCAPTLLEYLPHDFPLHMKKVAVGVRPRWYRKSKSHAMPMTPDDAIKRGADYLVIGDPLTRPREGQSFQQAAEAVINQVKFALRQKEESM